MTNEPEKSREETLIECLKASVGPRKRKLTDDEDDFFDDSRTFEDIPSIVKAAEDIWSYFLAKGVDDYLKADFLPPLFWKNPKDSQVCQEALDQLRHEVEKKAGIYVLSDLYGHEAKVDPHGMQDFKKRLTAVFDKASKKLSLYIDAKKWYCSGTYHDKALIEPGFTRFSGLAEFFNAHNGKIQTLTLWAVPGRQPDWPRVVDSRSVEKTHVQFLVDASDYTGRQAALTLLTGAAENGPGWVRKIAQKEWGDLLTSKASLSL